MRSTVTAGALVRRHVRANLDVLGAQWTEHKGLTESTFVVDAPEQDWKRLLDWMRDSGLMQR